MTAPPSFQSALVREGGALPKRAFGLVTILVGLLFLAVGVGQTWLTGEPFRAGMLLVALIYGAVFLYFGTRWLLNVVYLDSMSVDPGRPEMIDAVHRAQASLDRFWRYVEQGQYTCQVKFPLSTRRGTRERVWAVVHGRTGDKVVVSFDDEPYAEPEADDERLTVAVAEIEDWQVTVSKTEVHGGYSFGALAQIARSRRQRLSRADRKRHETLVDLRSE